MAVSDNTKLANGLSEIIKSLGEKAPNVSKKMAKILKKSSKKFGFGGKRW